MFYKRQSQFVKNIVTGNETWLYFNDVLLNTQNKFQIFEVEETSVTVKKSQSVENVMVPLFFKSSEIVHFVLDT